MKKWPAWKNHAYIFLVVAGIAFALALVLHLIWFGFREHDLVQAWGEINVFSQLQEECEESQAGNHWILLENESQYANLKELLGGYAGKTSASSGMFAAALVEIRRVVFSRTKSTGNRSDSVWVC